METMTPLPALGGNSLGQSLPSQLGENLADAAALPPRPFLDRKENVVVEVHGGAHASDANASTGGTGSPGTSGPVR